jgi:uncharacterized protein (UPF0335 family)
MAKRGEDDDIMGPAAGHNSGGDRLLSLIERVERLEEDKKGVADDIKEVFAEAKAEGWDTKVMRRVIAYRKRNKDEVAEEEAVFELYLSSLGMLPDGD